MRNLLQLQRVRPLSTALAITCLGPCVLQAQNAADRPPLDQLRLELHSATSLAEVDQVASQWDSSAPRPVERLGDTYILLRRAVLAGKKSTFASAWKGFDQSVRSHPDWPYARFGLALTALEIHVRRFPLPADYDNVASGTHYDGYASQMARTLRARPGFQPAIDWVVATMLDEGAYQQPGAILAALRFIADSTDLAAPGIELALARADLLAGDPARSMRRISAYVREGGDSGIALLEQARALAWTGSLDSAAVSYLAGAQVPSNEAKGAYWMDIDWVASPDELSRYAASGDSIGAFMTAFWSNRDAQEYQRGGSQLQEHLRRSVYVRQKFPAPAPGYRALFLPYGVATCQQPAGPDSPPGRAVAPQLSDSRAVLYMRYGASMHPQGSAAIALRAATGDGNPALAYRYDAGLMSGANVMSSGTGTTPTAARPVNVSTRLAPFVPTPVAPVRFDRDIAWVYVVQGRIHEAELDRCRH